MYVYSMYIMYNSTVCMYIVCILCITVQYVCISEMESQANKPSELEHFRLHSNTTVFTPDAFPRTSF